MTSLPMMVMDIETFYLPEASRGGFTAQALRAAGIGWMCVYAIHERRMYHFDRHTAKDAASLLNGAVVVGWNIDDFDIPLYEACTGIALQPHHTEDLFAKAKAATGGVWIGVDEAAKFTIGRGKTGNGADAPALAQAGRWAELALYTSDDVMLEHDVFAFVQKHGYLRFAEGIVPLSVWCGVDAWQWPHRQATERQVAAIRAKGLADPLDYYEARRILNRR